MSTIYAATRGPNLSNTRTAIAERTPFNAGNIKGVERPSTFGQMPSAFERFFGADVSYTITSYRTPIAWYSPTRGWIVPDHRYSVSTTRHQSVVRHALTLAGIDFIHLAV